MILARYRIFLKTNFLSELFPLLFADLDKIF